MSKKMVIAILLIMLLIGTISLYSTFAYNEQLASLDESTADYNLIYSIKENSERFVTVASNEEKYVNVTLYNPYEATVKYGMYYYLVGLDKLPENVSVTLADDSIDILENIIKSKQTRDISIRITNKSGYSIDMQIGALIGFENGNIEDLAINGEVLIK